MNTFLQYNTFAKITIYDEDKINIPAFTICDNNKISKTLVEKNENEFVQKVLKSLFVNAPLKPHINLSDPAILSQTKGIDMFSIYERNKANVSISRIYFDDKELKLQDYLRRVRTSLGDCFEFDPRHNSSRLVVTQPGAKFGLRILSYTLQNDYYTGVLSAGVYVILTIRKHSSTTFVKL